MTIQEVIDRVDELAPNQYTDDQKMHWLTDLDGKVFHEVFRTHEPGFGMMYPFDAYEDAEHDLLIPPPYASDIYVNYLLSRISEANAEIQKYNLYSQLFNSEYQAFVNWFNRTHKPKSAGGWKF